MVLKNSTIRVDIQFALNIKSRVSGLLRVERKKKIELKIFFVWIGPYGVFDLSQIILLRLMRNIFDIIQK